MWGLWPIMKLTNKLLTIRNVTMVKVKTLYMCIVVLPHVNLKWNSIGIFFWMANFSGTLNRKLCQSRLLAFQEIKTNKNRTHSLCQRWGLFFLNQDKKSRRITLREQFLYKCIPFINISQKDEKLVCFFS